MRVRWRVRWGQLLVRGRENRGRLGRFEMSRALAAARRKERSGEVMAEILVDPSHKLK
jgi:hypothetical protein